MAYPVVFLPGWSLVARWTFGVHAVRFFATHLSAKRITRNLTLGGLFGVFFFASQPDLTTAVSRFCAIAYTTTDSREDKRTMPALKLYIMPASVANLIFTRCSAEEKWGKQRFGAPS